MRYSKGPWVVDGHMVVSHSMPRRVWGDKGQWSAPFIVCQPHLYVSSEGSEIEANARLIAAAPELLEALTGFIAEFGDKTDNNANVRKARAAIAKAKGETE